MAQARKGEHYHHGDLRRALLDAGFRVAAERGVEAVTLREVARQAGVSHAAPYHHFADKAALLDALTVQAYGALTAALRAARETAPGDALDGLRAIGAAYVRFALGHPTAFHFLYRPGLGQDESSGEGCSAEIQVAAHAAYDVVLDAIKGGQEAGPVVSGDPETLALTVWAMAHGLAVLLRDGAYDQHARGAVEVDDLAALVFAPLIAGLGA